jgi:DNA-binding GntR family transcriptional regulator
VRIPPKSHTQLARKIVNYFKKLNLQADERIREQAIADQFGVSRTPVRGALTMLHEQGILTYVAKQGYSLADGANELSEDGITLPQTTEEQLFSAIMRDRVANRLDEQITISDLMRRYSNGRAEVTRVLTQMSADGLIERGSGQSWVFGPALDSLSAGEESYRFRLQIEPAALLEPQFHINDAQCQIIHDQHSELLESSSGTIDTKQFYELDRAFHELIAQSCHNRFLRQAIIQQTKLRSLARSSGTTGIHRQKESLREHLRVLDAIEAKNNAQAAILLRDHIRISHDQRPRLGIRGVPPLAVKHGHRV